jgi:hypothetical protein
VEQLREERRKAKKLALSRHTSIAKGDVLVCNLLYLTCYTEA